MHVTGGKTLGLVVKLSLVLSLLGTWPKAACKDDDQVFIKYQIHIKDALSDPNSKLIVHCKSGDSDKGIKELPPGGEYEWGTRINLVRTTLFYCLLRWEGVKEMTFIAFKATRDEDRCGPKRACFWRVKDVGVFFSGNNATWFNAYPW